MADLLEKSINDLKKIDEKIDEVSKQWTVLKHEYRSSKDPILRIEIKKKWDKLQKKIEMLEKKRRVIIEKKNEIEFKGRWKGWK
jgi:predicted nuclease with TOPRIM domain